MPQVAEQFAVDEYFPFAGAEPRAQGRDGRRLLEAARRARVHYTLPLSTPQAVRFAFLEATSVLGALRLYSRSVGGDLDATINDAAKHFTASQIVRRTEPLTQAELESLFEDDQRTSGW